MLHNYVSHAMLHQHVLPYYCTDLRILYTFAHLIYIFSDYNAFNIQFWTCNRDVNMVAAVIFFLLPRSI